MSDDGLKRVGLVFKADGAVDFKNSLSEVNNAVKENQAAYKLAKSEWDSSTSSQQKLLEQQKYLEAQTQTYAEKVRALNEILENQEAAENRDEAAISKTKVQLDQAQASQNYYEQGLKRVNDELQTGAAQLKDYADKVGKVGDKLTTAGETMTKVSAGIVAIGTAAVASRQEIDSAYDTIASGTGAVGTNLEELKGNFDNVYGNFPADAADVSTALADVNTRFAFTGTQLEECSTDFLEFAKVNNTDVSSAIQEVSRYMGDASIPTSEYKTVLDALTAASQNSGISIDSLTTNLTKYGAPMRALGFETQESIAIFSQWEKAGVNTEIAFSGMKTAISNWSASGKDARVEFEKTLTEIQNCPDIASATSLAIETFGKKAGPDLADAIQGGRFSIEEFLSVVESSGGQLDATWGEMYDGADDAKVALNNLKLAGSDLGETILTTLAPTITSISEHIKEFREWFGGLNEDTKEMIVKIALLVAAIGPVLLLAGSACSSIQNILNLTAQLKMGIAGFSGLGIGGKITLIIVAIGAIITVLVTLYNKCEWFRNGVDTIATGISTVVGGVVNTVKGNLNDIKTAYDEHGGGLHGAVAGVLTGIKGLYENEYALINTLTGGKLDEIKNAFKDKMEEAKNYASEKLSAIKQSYDEHGGGIKGAAFAAIEGVKQYYSTGYDALNTLSGGKLDTVVSTVKGKLDDFKNGFTDKLDTVKEFVGGVVEDLKDLFTFDFPTPNIKMPHIKTSGKWSLNPLQTPSFSVDWYKNGGILNQPTIFGSAGGKLLGGGEAGKEAIAPLDTLMSYIRTATSEANMDLVSAMREVLGEVFYNALLKAFQILKPEIVLDDEKLGEWVLDLLRKEVFT